jgi:hypothetical protein
MIEFNIDKSPRHCLTGMNQEEAQVLLSALETSKASLVRSSLKAQLSVNMAEDKVNEILDNLYAALDDGLGGSY